MVQAGGEDVPAEGVRAFDNVIPRRRVGDANQFGSPDGNLFVAGLDDDVRSRNQEASEIRRAVCGATSPRSIATRPNPPLATSMMVRAIVTCG